MAKKKSNSRRRKLIAPETLTEFRLLSSPRVDPAGERIVYVEKTVSKPGSYDTRLWMVDSAGGEPRPFTHGPKDSRPVWSPAGDRVVFLRSAEKQPAQLYVIEAAGGEARRLTSFPPGSIGEVRFSPDGRHLAVAFRATPEERTEEAKKAREEAGGSTPPWVIDDPWFRLDGDGYFGAARYALYLVDAATGEHRLLYDRDTLGSFSFDWSPDSRRLAVATNRHKQALRKPWREEIVLLGIDGGKPQPVPDLPAGPKSHVRWSPDGKLLAYAGRRGKDGAYSTENLELWVCDPEKGNPRSLTEKEDFCLLSVCIADTAEAAFEPWFEFAAGGRRLLFRVGVRGEAFLASLPVKGGEVAYHTPAGLDLDPGNLSADGLHLALLASDPTTLPEVHIAEADDRGEVTLRPCTARNKELLRQFDLARPKSFTTRAEDGHEVHGWLLLPPRAKRKKHPAVLEIHGGPHAQYGSGFFHEFQVLAAAGYAVFYTNPRGSKGYGRDHCAAIRGAWGGHDWLDIQAVTRFMRKHPRVDPARMGVMGGSYGGYMTNWVIGHCHDFAAAITDRCVSNLVSMSGTSDFPLEPDRYFPGNAWDDTAPRWNQSPLQFLGDCRTPTLVIHSEGDLRCAIEQGEQVYHALALLGVPVRMIRYPAEASHGMSRNGPPDLRLHRLRHILQWWEKYL